MLSRPHLIAEANDRSRRKIEWFLQGRDTKIYDILLVHCIGFCIPQDIAINYMRVHLNLRSV